MQTDPAVQLQAPSQTHWWGTDLLGRDVLSRTLYGGRQTLQAAVLATLLASVLGLPLGLMARARNPLLAAAALASINAMLALPGLIVALVVITLLGRGVLPLILALGLSEIAPFAFATRGAVGAIHSEGYIEAAVNLGANERHILVDHVWPNVQPTVIAYAGVVFSYMLLNGAALGFLGLGSELGTPEWGVMLAEGRAAFRVAPWISLAPGLMLSLTIWAVNDLADRILQRDT